MMAMVLVDGKWSGGKEKEQKEKSYPPSPQLPPLQDGYRNT